MLGTADEQRAIGLVRGAAFVLGEEYGFRRDSVNGHLFALDLLLAVDPKDFMVHPEDRWISRIAHVRFFHCFALLNLSLSVSFILLDRTSL